MLWVVLRLVRAQASFSDSTVFAFSQMDNMSRGTMWEETDAWSDGYEDWCGERVLWSPDGSVDSKGPQPCMEVYWASWGLPCR